MQRSLFVLAITGVLASIVYLAVALTYPLGSLRKPGPAAFPLFVGALLFISSVGAFRAAIKTASGKVEWPRGAALRRIFIILAAILAYISMFSYLGHPFATVVLILVSFLAMGTYSWPVRVGFAVAVAAASYYLFNVLLNVQLPLGFLSR